MNAVKMAAIVLIVAGALGLAYGGFSYTSDTHEAKLGPLELSVKERETRSATASESDPDPGSETIPASAKARARPRARRSARGWATPGAPGSETEEGEALAERGSAPCVE